MEIGMILARQPPLHKHPFTLISPKPSSKDDFDSPSPSGAPRSGEG
jgi:hypothetical protein